MGRTSGNAHAVGVRGKRGVKELRVSPNPVAPIARHHADGWLIGKIVEISHVAMDFGIV